MTEVKQTSCSELVTAVHARLDLLLTTVKYFRALEQKQLKG
jgi:hypothetical protein